MPMLFWLPLILFGGMLSVAFGGASTDLPAGSTGETAPAQSKRAAPRNPFEL